MDGWMDGWMDRWLVGWRMRDEKRLNNRQTRRSSIYSSFMGTRHRCMYSYVVVHGIERALGVRLSSRRELEDIVIGHFLNETMLLP